MIEACSSDAFARMSVSFSGQSVPSLPHLLLLLLPRPRPLLLLLLSTLPKLPRHVSRWVRWLRWALVIHSSKVTGVEWMVFKVGWIGVGL